MKRTGELLISLGAILGVYAFMFFDTTVEMANGNRIINFSLMDERRNMLMVAGVLAIIGAIMYTRNNESKKAERE